MHRSIKLLSIRQVKPKNHGSESQPAVIKDNKKNSHKLAYLWTFQADFHHILSDLVVGEMNPFFENGVPT